MVKPGDFVDRYRIEEPIGEGGMGLVFRAHDERLDRRVALKVLHDGGEGAESRARLVREARSVAKLDHPNVVAVHDVGEHAEGPFIVMELIEGRSVRSLIGDASVGPAERVRIMTDVARGLAIAHDAGVVHRDVKPENVLVRRDGRVKVVDFGIARRTKSGDASAPTTDSALSTLTADGVKVGTPMYMAPEQIKGTAVDGRADQFAWAVTAYEVFVGRPPWSGDDAMALIAAILTEDPVPPSAEAQMPHGFSGVVRKALSKRPEDRFASMHELLSALEKSVTPSLVGSVPAPVVPARPAAGSPVHSAPSRSAPPHPSPPSAAAPVYVPPSHPPAAYAGPPSYVPQASALSRRYSTKEVADIFDRALGAQQRRFRYEEIAEAAREVGLDERTLQESMTELSRRGAMPVSSEQREADMMRVKRLAAIWGVIAAFFALLNLSEPRELWFQYPAICIGLPFALMIVRILFRAPEPRKANVASGDPAIEYDVARMTQYFQARPVAPVAHHQPQPQLRVAPMEAQPPRSHESQIRREAEAEVEALLAQPDPQKQQRR